MTTTASTVLKSPFSSRNPAPNFPERLTIHRYQSNATHSSSFTHPHLDTEKGNGTFWDIILSLPFALSEVDGKHGKSVFVKLVKSNTV